MPHLAKLDGDAFLGFVADRTIAALIELAEAAREAETGQRAVRRLARAWDYPVAQVVQ